MTQILFIVGVFVFFITVSGAVMIGGHLLEELEHEESARSRLLPEADNAAVGAVRASS
jgi:hypothetical protein